MAHHSEKQSILAGNCSLPGTACITASRSPTASLCTPPLAASSSWLRSRLRASAVVAGVRSWLNAANSSLPMSTRDSGSALIASMNALSSGSFSAGSRAMHSSSLIRSSLSRSASVALSKLTAASCSAARIGFSSRSALQRTESFK